MKTLLAIPIGMLFSFSAAAEVFIDLGLGYAPRTDFNEATSCITHYEDHKLTCSSSPLGYAAIGYKYNDLTISAEHWSSLQDKDAGLDIISVKYRFTFGNKNK